MKRVVILGPCGAGKSTLSFTLAERLDLPLFHMDRLAWKPGWIDSSRDELQVALAPIVAGDRWLIDGNYASTLPQRLGRADTAVVLDYPIPLCLWRILRRYGRYRGQTRPEMTEGCPEQLDMAFLWYAARFGGGPRRRLHAALDDFEGKVVSLKSPRLTAVWLDTLDRRAV